MTTFWTSAAHADFFTRNIITTVGWAPSSPEARAVNEFASNAATVAWPTVDEVERWLTSTSYQGAGGDTDIEFLQLAVDVAVSRLAQRTQTLVRPVDADGAVDPDGDPVAILPELKLAAIIQACKWYERRSTPNGVLGATEFGGIIRSSAFDADVEALIGNHRMPGLA